MELDRPLSKADLTTIDEADVRGSSVFAGVPESETEE